MSSPGACGRDPAATVAFPRAADDVARRVACGATWHGLKAPAEAVLEAAGLLVRCVEAARRLRSQIPRQSSSPEYKTEAAVLWRDVERGRDASEGGSGTRRSQRGLAALQSAAGVVGGRGKPWRRRSTAPARLEVGDDWVDLSIICEKFRGLSEN